MMSLFRNFVIEHSILAIQYALYKKGSKGMGSAFHLPTQVTIMIAQIRALTENTPSWPELILSYSTITVTAKKFPTKPFLWLQE